MTGRTTHHSLEERLEAVLLYLSGQVGSSRLAKQYGVSGHTVQVMIENSKPTKH